MSLFLLPATLAADEPSYIFLQSGSLSGGTPLYDRGIHGEGEVIAVLDTGADYDSCYLAEPGGSPPPINTGNPLTGFSSSNVDPSRRKIIAYDFLYSCAQYPGAFGCDDPVNPRAYDNQGHGTHAATSAAGDKGAPGQHDFADGVAPAAKLVIQDAGLTTGDACSQRPGLGCPLIDLRTVLDQAWHQGARIHSNSWGDRQGVAPPATPPTGNYSPGALQIDDFVWNHPEMVVVFNTGNAGTLGASSISAPGDAKNTIQVGGVRLSSSNSRIESYSGTGPTRDGRIKPDVVASAQVLAGDPDFDVTTSNCNVSQQGGTSWSSPTVAGAVALVRQYYRQGFYPAGVPLEQSAFEPSAALVKATLLASARRAPLRQTAGGVVASEPVPSFEQGFGIPVLDDSLYFAGETRRLKAIDIRRSRGLFEGARYTVRLTVREGTSFKVFLVWTDPPGMADTPASPRLQLVNDLDLRLIDPAGNVALGNERLHPGLPDRVNNVEAVMIESPVAGTYQITVRANRINQGLQQDFALVIAGDFSEIHGRRRAVRRSQ